MGAEVIDACLHHRWANQAEVMEYMSSGWREYIGEPGSLPGGAGAIPLVPGFPYKHPDGEELPSAAGDGPAGSSLQTLREQVLDPLDIELGILSFEEAMLGPAMPSTRLGAAVARAANDWTIDRWLQPEPRLRGLILVPTQVPEDAVAEIVRIGDDPRMAGVLLCVNGLGKPFGHPAYHPIYAAAAERGLPIVIHDGGDAIAETLTHPTAGGLPATYAEYDAFRPQALATHLVTLVAQGVFDRFPELRVLLVGGGVTWISALMWRFDTEYRTFRREAPWLTRKPNEYIRDHVRFATYPLERTDPPETLRRLLALHEDLDDLLIYGSGYPRRDADTPAEVADLLPVGWSEKVLAENARSFFRAEPVADTIEEMENA
jgi:uncharacterized protein